MPLLTMRASRLLLALLVAVSLASCKRPAPPPPPSAPPPPQPEVRRETFEVTAYSIKGRTAAGTRPRDGTRATNVGTVAADPKVLPLGSRVRILDAGRYSGEYRVEDTGRTVKGRELDIYLADAAEARHFGRRTLQVEILQRGGREASR